MAASATQTASRDRALSLRQLTKRWRVDKRKVKELVRRGLLRPLDFGVGAGLGKRVQWRFTPEDVAACERRLAAGPVARPRRRREALDPEIVALLET